LAIPKLKLDLAVKPVGYETVKENGRTKIVWDTLPNVASFHETSAYPGTGGNTVINGHRDIEGSVFRNLNKMEVGDTITLYVGDVEYLYRVIETKTVLYIGASAEERAEHTQLLGRTSEERLTLVTCTPVFLATHRLYVIAEPVELVASMTGW
jgi:sortase A